jgi:hypothetical protein
MVSGSATKVNTPGVKISIESKIAHRIHIAESRSDNQFRYIKNKIVLRIHILIGDYILTYKKSAERPLSDVQTGAPRNENRFASSNRHRTKKKRLAFSRKRKHGEGRADVDLS